MKKFNNIVWEHNFRLQDAGSGGEVLFSTMMPYRIARRKDNITTLASRVPTEQIWVPNVRKRLEDSSGDVCVDESTSEDPVTSGIVAHGIFD